MNYEDLLNKFLDGELTAADQALFDLWYAQDQAFRDQINQCRDILKGIDCASIEKIRQEIKAVSASEAPLLWKQMEFEQDLSKALTLKNREKMKDEIQKAMRDAKASNGSKPEGKMISLKPGRIFAIAASLLVLLSLGLFYIWNKKMSTTGIWQEAMAQSYEELKMDARTSGLADPEQGYRNLQRLVFELLDQSEEDKALIAIDAYFMNHTKDFTYHQLRGWVFFKSQKWDDAKSAFQAAVRQGDSCLSKLYYAFMNRQSAGFNQLVSEVKQNPACMELELVRSLLSQQGL